MGYKIRVSIEIVDEDNETLYCYSELLQTSGQVQTIEYRESADSIVKVMTNDVRRMCLLSAD